MQDNLVDTIKLKISDDDQSVGYLYLPGHPKKVVQGIIKNTVSIAELIKDYNGVPLYLDFDGNNKLIGIEISG